MTSYKNLQPLLQQYGIKRRSIRRRLKEFSSVPENKYFYELLYCLLTPQSKAVHAAKVQHLFEACNYKHAEINPESFLLRKEHYIRFHITKAQRIGEMKKMYSAIHTVVTGTITASEKREWLANNVKGLSYKEATHFLRNIGKNEGLTILDRHILKNLNYHGVIRSVPSVITRKRYFQIEKKFLAFAAAVGISADELDLLFWSKEAGEILK